MSSRLGGITMSQLNIPGQNEKANAMLPARVAIFSAAMAVAYPLLLTVCILRAVFMRTTKGTPSQILQKGTYNNAHLPDQHYTCQLLFDKPLEEPRLRAALVELCAEDGITEDQIDLSFEDATPASWPATGSHRMNAYLPAAIGEDDSYVEYWSSRGKSGKVVRLHVFNAKAAGEPTVVLYAGSINAWDGSSNFNFVKQLMRRYAGESPQTVFQSALSTDIMPAAAATLDAAVPFALYLAKMPLNLAKSLGGALWNAISAQPRFGGNGFGFKLCAMNLDEEESKALYNGAKALGVSPFACFTWAGVRACKRVLGYQPKRIVQQASLQTRHFPVEGQGDQRDLVGDWLVGPVQYVGDVDYDLPQAQASYADLRAELDALGPRTCASLAAKAWGVVNCGAAPFECVPTYNDDAHVFDKTIFMNNYGVRTMPEEVGFRAWNWNAPLWLGINTINVNGRTTTLVGSCMFGLEVAEALRDEIEAALREVIAKGREVPAEEASAVPTYRGV